MKWFRLSLVTRQLIILGLVVALLWVDGKPVPGPDGRIVCVSTDYPNLIAVPPWEPYPKGGTLKIQVITNSKARSLLNGIPITKSYRLEANEFLINLCGYFPSLRKVPQINTRLRSKWVYHFRLFPHELEILEDAKRNNYSMLFYSGGEFIIH